MTRAHKVLQVAAAGLIGGSCLAASKPAVAADMMVLAPHRAVYDLTLSKSRGKRPIQMVRGRILYDFSGSACEGYALQFRQVSEIDNGEGKQALSDLRAATWEDGQGKSFRFNSENKIDNRVADTVDGSAERNTAGVAVKLTKPKTASSISTPRPRSRPNKSSASSRPPRPARACSNCLCMTARRPATRCFRPSR